MAKTKSGLQSVFIGHRRYVLKVHKKRKKIRERMR